MLAQQRQARIVAELGRREAVPLAADVPVTGAMLEPDALEAPGRVVGEPVISPVERSAGALSTPADPRRGA